MWIRAFGGFYNPRSNTKKLDSVSKWLFASRSVIWIISAQAAIIAGILSFASGRFNAVYFVLLLAGFVIAHATSNLLNDYFGYKRGQDKENTPRRLYTIHPIADGLVTAKELINAIILLMIAGLLIATYFVLVRGYMTILFLAVGSLFLFGYDASPITLKSIGLGEISAFIVWGPLMVGGGYYIITGLVNTNAFIAGIPYGLGVMSVLIGKHIDQIGFDKKEKQHTLPVILGESKARILNIIVIAAMYISTMLMAFYEIVTFFAMAVLLNLFNATYAIGVLSEKRPKTPPKGYAGWPLWYHRASLSHNRKFGWLYIIGLTIGTLFRFLMH